MDQMDGRLLQSIRWEQPWYKELCNHVPTLIGEFALEGNLHWAVWTLLRVREERLIEIDGKALLRKHLEVDSKFEKLGSGQGFFCASCHSPWLPHIKWHVQWLWQTQALAASLQGFFCEVCIWWRPELEQQSSVHLRHHTCCMSRLTQGHLFRPWPQSPCFHTSLSQTAQIDSGYSCNTIHVTDLNKLSPVWVDLSSVCLLDYSKSVIPTSGQTTLQYTWHGKSYKIIVQLITAAHYYAPL